MDANRLERSSTRLSDTNRTEEFGSEKTLKERKKRAGLRFAISGSSASVAEGLEDQQDKEKKKPMNRISRSLSSLAGRSKSKPNLGAVSDDSQEPSRKPKPARRKKKSPTMTPDEAAEAILNGELIEHVDDEDFGSEQGYERTVGEVSVDDYDEDEFGDLVGGRQVKESPMVSEGYGSGDEDLVVKWANSSKQMGLGRAPGVSHEIARMAREGSFTALVDKETQKEEAAQQSLAVAPPNSASARPILSPVSPAPVPAAQPAGIEQKKSANVSRIFKPFDPTGSLDAQSSVSRSSSHVTDLES